MPRSPSASAHKKALDAAIALIAKQGIETTSMDAIAKQSGVSKATIYKHWTDKNSLLLEVMAVVNGLHLRPDFDSGNTRADLVKVLAYRPKEYADVREQIMPHFMAYSAHNQEVGMAWRNMVMDPPRRELRHLLKLAISRGKVIPQLDLDLSLSLLLGPIIYWFVFLRNVEEDPTRLAEGVVDAFWRAFSLPSRKNTTNKHRKLA
ncbi:MAG TPA: TetR/AcrR family transcriptional regulator [Bryobacteraceae bacterium]|jgi:AcrR family transcriptional regulator|nr:TetR/AcrR family transcriptional regulator [Bryobacteraceae bacterium]